MSHLQPSPLWTNWQSLKGTHFRNLTVKPTDLQGRRIILTGGNNGIGLEAAVQFAAWGAHVVLGCRPNPPRTEVSPDDAVKRCLDAARKAGHSKVQIEHWECDMASLESVNKFAQRYLATGHPLDILCNNAGMTSGFGKPVITNDGFEIVHQVNFLSHTLMTLTLLPALAKATSPRIVCTTSCMQYFGIFDLEGNANSGKNAYPNNKLYFQTWLTELQCRLLKNPAYSHIVAHGVHPGYVQTGIWQTDLSKMEFLERSLNQLLPYIGINAQQGSLTIVHAATAEEGNLQPIDQLEGTGFLRGGAKYFNRTWEETPMPQTRDRDCRRQVWEFVGGELAKAGWDATGKALD